MSQYSENQRRAEQQRRQQQHTNNARMHNKMLRAEQADRDRLAKAIADKKR